MLKRNIDEHDDNDDDHNSKKFRSSTSLTVVQPTNLAVTTHNGKNQTKTRKSGLLSEVMLLTGHEGPVYSISFDPQGNHLASGSGDNNICN